jgi:NTE family protein
MSEPIHLKDTSPEVDPEAIGISYSGGGPLVLVELGIARAFVRKGIIPNVITGCSAGAIAGAAHALDPVGGKGIDMAARQLSNVKNGFLGLDAWNVIPRVLRYRFRIPSLGDNATIGPLIRDGVARDFGLQNVTIGTFAPPAFPKLLVVATNVVDGTSYWFPDEATLEEALICTSAIPGVFPWRTPLLGGQQRNLVDGGVVSNQPLSILVEHGCGTLYACAVGGKAPFVVPKNALDNALQAVQLLIHQVTKLEEDYVRTKLGEHGRVHHIHPEVPFPIHQFDFTPRLVEQVLDDACQRTIDWLNNLPPD